MGVAVRAAAEVVAEAWAEEDGEGAGVVLWFWQGEVSRREVVVFGFVFVSFRGFRGFGLGLGLGFGFAFEGGGRSGEVVWRWFGEGFVGVEFLWTWT